MSISTSIALPQSERLAPPRRSLRSLLAIDEQAYFQNLAKTLAGRALIFAIGLSAVAYYFGFWAGLFAISAALAAAYLPNYRNPILFTATWLATFVETALSTNSFAEHIALVVDQEGLSELPPVWLAVGAVFCLLVAIRSILVFVGQHPKSLIARRPVLTLLAIEGFICALTTLEIMHGLPRVLLWSMLIVATPFIWFLPYAIMDQRTAAPNPALLQMGALRPFWSPAYLPFGKGAAFLKKALPKTADDLAVTQLKGIKLLLWANALIAIQAVLGWIFLSQLNVPTVAESIDAFLQSRAYPLGISWTALAFSTTKFALQVAIWVHLFIGVARLAGYRLPRGSWRPLESRTLMDYFNRFHYYFKELLADFFFAPTFFTTFKKHPRLRMFFATFMAAAVGNALWHFIRDIDLIARIGPAAAFETYTSYLFYCVVLATGVGLSQVRVNSGIRPSNTVTGKLWSFIFVWSFVVCMHLFSDGSRQHSLDERLSFLATLFGVI
jgi:hypothetical protein